jgi:hypothetical protein
MSTTNPYQNTRSYQPESSWSDLFTIAGWVVAIMILLIPLQIVIYMLWPTPETVQESFALLQENKLAGLLSLEITYILSNILSIPLYLAFYVSLRRFNQSLMTIATAAGLIAIALVFTARPAFDLLFLSDQYAAATTEAQQALILAAGQAKIALQFGTAQNVHYVLGAIALLIISVVQLRSDVFSKTTAYVGIVANVLAFGLYMPKIGVYISILSVFPFLTIWLILSARTFFQLGRRNREAQPHGKKSSRQYTYQQNLEGARQ